MTNLAFQKSDWASAYQNVDNELSNIQLKVIKGEVPNSLHGILYRNGPGQLERDGRWVHHPFDGDGMIASMKFDNGTVSFSNRFVRTKAWEEEERANRFLYRGVFGTQKNGGFLNNAFDLRLKNIANTNVIKLGNKLLALWEASSPYELDPLNLETVGLSNLNGVLEANEAFSAHPRFDPGHHGDARIVNFGVKTGPQSTIRLMEFANEGDKLGKLLFNKEETFNGFSFLHDFLITPNWAIFLQNAISFNPLPFVLGAKGAAQCLSSNGNDQGKFLLIPRDSGSYSNEGSQIFNAPKGFVFHHLNAWEEDSDIIVESIYYNDFPTIKPGEDFREIDFNQIPEGILKRCKVNVRNKNLEVETLSKQCCEFAMVNPNFVGKKAQFAWMATAHQEVGNAPLQAIQKIDLINGKKISWSAAPRGFVSEPIMVPNSNTIEDEGWVLVLIWNAERLANDLVILRAKDLSEKAILELPIAIPHGLHGSWVNH